MLMEPKNAEIAVHGWGFGWGSCMRSMTIPHGGVRLAFSHFTTQGCSTVTRANLLLNSDLHGTNLRDKESLLTQLGNNRAESIPIW